MCQIIMQVWFCATIFRSGKIKEHNRKLVTYGCELHDLRRLTTSCELVWDFQLLHILWKKKSEYFVICGDKRRYGDSHFSHFIYALNPSHVPLVPDISSFKITTKRVKCAKSSVKEANCLGQLHISIYRRNESRLRQVKYEPR